MSDNIKIVKVDPTGFFVKKDKSPVSSDSEILDDSSDSSTDDDEPMKENNLSPLPRVPTNVSVIKEREVTPFITPSETSIVVTNARDMEMANNYLSTTPKPQDSNPSIPFNNNTSNNENTNNSSTENSESLYSDSDSQSDEQAIDMTDNGLYNVLEAVLIDDDGENIGQILSKVNKNLEKHNDTMNKCLTQYMEMNREKAKERRYLENLTQAIHNQNRILERLMNHFEKDKHFHHHKPASSTYKKDYEDEEDPHEVAGGQTILPKKVHSAKPNPLSSRPRNGIETPDIFKNRKVSPLRVEKM